MGLRTLKVKDEEACSEITVRIPESLKRKIDEFNRQMEDRNANRVVNTDAVCTFAIRLTMWWLH